MAFFNVEKTQEAVKDSGGSYILQSGMYPVKINFAAVNVNTHGARSIDFNVDYKGTTNTLYGLKLDDNQGNEHFQRALFNKLCVIAGFDTIYDPVKQTHVVGKDQVEKEFDVLDQFSGVEVIVRVRAVYSVYNDEIKQKFEIANFFRIEDKATASEIISGANYGKQYEKEEAKASESTYQNNLTEDEVKAWLEARKKGTPADKVKVKETAPAVKNPFADQ